jgi:hypothetical protein
MKAKKHEKEKPIISSDKWLFLFFYQKLILAKWLRIWMLTAHPFLCSSRENPYKLGLLF